MASLAFTCPPGQPRRPAAGLQQLRDVWLTLVEAAQPVDNDPWDESALDDVAYAYCRWAEAVTEHLAELARAVGWTIATDGRADSRYIVLMPTDDDADSNASFEVRIADHAPNHGGFDHEIRIELDESMSDQLAPIEAELRARAKTCD